MTSTSSVLNLWRTTVSGTVILTPEECISYPSHAIMAPLSLQNCLSGTNISAPRAWAMSSTMSLRRPFCATPPPRRTSLFPMWAMARSVTSVSIANAVSWTESAMSSSGTPFLWSATAAVIMPEKATSMPLTEYGSSWYSLPSFASFSNIGPA